jgi:hypothetical protein
MFSKPFLTSFRHTSVISIPLLAVLLAGGLTPMQMASQATAQIKSQVAEFASQPVKVTATTVAPSTVGAKSQIQVGLLNADNQPVPAKEDSQYEVTITPPSGTSTSQTLFIKKGQNTSQFDFSPAQAGVTSITVRPLAQGVRADKAMFVVHPSAKALNKKKAIGPQGSLVWPDRANAKERFWAFDTSRLEFRTVAYSLTPSAPSPGPDNGGQPAKSSPILHVYVDNIADAHYANGKDSAVISAIYDSPDFSAAPSNIHIFFNLSTGALDPPIPLQIPKGAFKGEADLTSTSPADVHVTFTSSNPRFPTEGDTDFIVHFVPPIVQLNVPSKLSIVDNPSVTADFFDEHGIEMSIGQNYQISLRSEQSKLRFTPDSFQPPTGHAALFPTSVGSDTIDATLAHYPLQKLSIVITGWLVLGLCLGGGVAGGVAAYDKFKGSWLWRIFLGILGGAVLCWLYIYLALPSINANIAHNTFSVFFVALLGGYGGTTTLDFAAKKLNLGV